MAFLGNADVDILQPRPLVPGDTVAICAPAGRFNHDLLPPAVYKLQLMGYNVRVMPHTLGECGTYSGTVGDRLADMREALTDPAVRAIICARGGYGAVQLLQQLSRLPLRDDPKWLVGFSDITALHALFARAGVASLHAPMLKAFAPAEMLSLRMIFSILAGDGRFCYKFKAHPLNRDGIVTARIVGGNLAVMTSLVGTPFDMIRPGRILFIEDINEPIYAVERRLWQLRLSGALEHLAGLVVGRFTGYTPDANYDSMEQMIAAMVAPYDYPVMYGVPIGHVNPNFALIENARVRLAVQDTVASLVVCNS